MAQLTRVQQKIFGSTGTVTQFAQIGSLAAGAVLKTKDIATIQALGQYDSGLYAITNSASEPPRIQDINSLYYLATTQLAYMFQTGIPEWETNTEYYQNVGYVQKAGVLYRSIRASVNQGIDPSSSLEVNWSGLMIGGNTLIGTTVNSGPRLVVSDGGVLPSIAAGTVGLFQSNSSAASNCLVSIISGNAGSSYLRFGDSDLEYRGEIRYDHSSDSFKISTVSAQAMEITSAKHLLLNTTSDPGEILHVNGSARFTGSVGYISILSTGDIINFSSASANVLLASTVGGYLRVTTNGRNSSIDSAANLVFNADQSVIVNTTLLVDTISEKTAAAGITLNHTLKVDTISEKTASAGIKFNHETKPFRHYEASSVTQDAVFGAINSWFEGVNGSILPCKGLLKYTTPIPINMNIICITKISATVLRVIGNDVDGSQIIYTITDGSTANIVFINLKVDFTIGT